MANPLDYNVNSIAKGVNGFGRKPAATGYKFNATLAAATEQNFAIPSSSSMGTISATQTNMFLAIFSYQPTVQFWVSVNGTAAVPVGGTWAAATSELLPNGYIVKAGDTISAISTAGGSLSVALYTIPDA